MHTHTHTQDLGWKQGWRERDNPSQVKNLVRAECGDRGAQGGAQGDGSATARSVWFLEVAPAVSVHALVACVCVCVCVCMWVCICIYVYVYMYIYI
jgi:hypothetical protein